MPLSDRADDASQLHREVAGGRLSLPSLVKFVAMAAMLAMYADAAVAHAILWQNDPYWTYWVTDALLMATVYGLGTAWFGVGLGRGAILTLVHVLLLTTYYWTLSPIGLPGQPEWLDLERTWITGLPVHLAVYYLGYVTALWLWNRSRRLRMTTAGHDCAPGPTVTLAIAVAAAVTLVLGLFQTWVTGQFPGLTWFIVRIAVVTPFVVAWWAIAGLDRVAAVSGGVMVGFLLLTYSHYLSPVGLPNPSLRLWQANPPPAVVEWLSYRQEFLILLPIALVLAIAALLLASRWLRPTTAPQPAATKRVPRSVLIAAVLVPAVLGTVAFFHTGPDDLRVTLASAGPAALEQGLPLSGDFAPSTASLTMTVTNRNTHRTPLPPHDEVDIRAQIAGQDGQLYALEATQPVVAEPRGRHTTWAGVGFERWHHGRSGIGSPALPPTRSDVAVYALGILQSGGRTVAVNVPVHVMTSARPDARLELHVGDPDAALADVPGGYLRVVWVDYSGGTIGDAKNARYAFGGGLLLVLLGLVLMLVRREAPLVTVRTHGERY